MFGFFKTVAQKREEFELEKEQIRFQDERNERIRLEESRREEESAHCDSCDILQRELAMMRSERDQLLSKIINPVTSEQPIRNTEPPKPLNMSRHLPFNARRQVLEQNDRERARAAQNAEKVTGVKTTPAGEVIGSTTSSVEELEKELGIEKDA